jgi:cyanate permease
LVIGHDFGVRSFGTIAGMLGTVALTLGGALGPVIVGVLYDNTGSYQGALALCTTLMLAGAVIVAMAPELQKKSSRGNLS